MSFGNYLENELLDHVFGMAGSNYTSPATIYCGIGTSTCGEAGTAWGEPWGIGTYARVAITPNGFGAATAGTVLNATTVQFVEAGAAWGSMTHFGLYDAATIGNFLGGGTLTTMRYIDSGDTARFAVSDMTVTLE